MVPITVCFGSRKIPVILTVILKQVFEFNINNFVDPKINSTSFSLFILQNIQQTQEHTI